MDIKILASSSRGNAYYITDGITSLLIECGIPWKVIRQKLNFQTSSIAACLISHSHLDHCKAWKDVAKAGIDIYATQETFDALQATGHRIKPIRPLDQFEIGSWVCLAFDTQHDCAGSVGYLLQSATSEKLLFITDSFYCRYKFNGVNYLMVECNHSLDLLRDGVKNGYIDVAQKNRLMQSHFSLERVKEFLQANDLSQIKAIYLLHLSYGNSDADRFKREIQELTGKPVYIFEE